MKAVLLAGGHGTRLSPFTSYCNKHLLPIYHHGIGTPIIEFGIKALREAGIKDVTIVLGDYHCEDIFSFLQDGSQYGMHFNYVWQGEPLGIAQAVDCALGSLDLSIDDSFYVYLGDNFFSNGIAEFVKKTENCATASLLFAHTKTPERFGCPVFGPDFYDQRSELINLIEKPSKTRTDLAISGCYYFDIDYFDPYFHHLKPSKRGEYEITDLLNNMLKDDIPIDFHIYDGFWSDMGTYESIMEVEKYLNR